MPRVANSTKISRDIETEKWQNVYELNNNEKKKTIDFLFYVKKNVSIYYDQTAKNI